MSSERRTVEGSTPDGVADRTQGYTHNPNPADELAEQRAHFAEQQRKYQEERAAAADALQGVQQATEDRYEEAQHKPEHQAFVAEQHAHQQVDPPHTEGGQDQIEDRPAPSAAASGVKAARVGPATSAPIISGEIPREAPLPADRGDADRTEE